jgi:hypothetical protein
LESLDYIHPAIMQTLPPDGASTDAVPATSNGGLYLALSFNSACNEPWLRGQLAKKMTELAASGRSADAVKRNLALWQAQSSSPVAVPNQ